MHSEKTAADTQVVYFSEAEIRRMVAFQLAYQWQGPTWAESQRIGHRLTFQRWRLLCEHPYLRHRIILRDCPPSGAP